MSTTAASAAACAARSPHAAVLCPSFYRAEIVQNPTLVDRAARRRARRAIAACAAAAATRRRGPRDRRRNPRGRSRSSIAALGGEGGGVLTDWLVAAAMAADLPVQSTSIPGVAQRTGATTYYVEIFPATRRRARRHAARCWRSIPCPGDIDVVVASELLEAGRAIAERLRHAERTTLIASTHRIYAIAEKMQMGDGRFDASRILRAAREMARAPILFDLHAHDAAARQLSLNAVLLGALAGSRRAAARRAADCEAAIRAGGRSPSRRISPASRLGLFALARRRPATAPRAIARRDGRPLGTRAAAAPRQRSFRRRRYAIVEEGVRAARSTIQDAAYAQHLSRPAAPPRRDATRAAAPTATPSPRDGASSRAVDGLRGRDPRRRPEEPRDAARARARRGRAPSRTSRCTSPSSSSRASRSSRAILPPRARRRAPGAGPRGAASPTGCTCRCM